MKKVRAVSGGNATNQAQKPTRQAERGVGQARVPQGPAGPRPQESRADGDDRALEEAGYGYGV